MEEKIKEYLEKSIRPHLQNDGGDLEFVDFKEGIVRVRLQGACMGCPGATMTLKMGVERQLKNLFPEVKRVDQVRD
jgi:Fe-S cluster biogenesis protein NfuA